MALRCSLLGHAYDDADAERTRTERGERVVVTVRDVRTCGRCGATDVVGERREVVTADARAGDHRGAAERGARETAGGTHPAATDPETDDGIIIEGTDDGDRARGEWPRRGRPDEDDDSRPWPGASGEVPEVESSGWPEPRGDDDGFDAEPAGEGGADVEFGGGLTPERAGDPPDDAEVIEPAPDAAETPGVADRAGVPPDDGTEFACPACGFAVHSAAASVRPGDVCPECQSDYLAERRGDG